MSYLGIDLGTSGLRALLIDEMGNPIGEAESTYNVSNPSYGWSEQNPAHWVSALEDVIAQLKKNYDAFNKLSGIGVAGHMHGATLLDSTGKVLSPCILWNDTRATEEAAELDKVEHVRELSANIVFPGFTAPKLLWIKKHQPDIFKKIAKVLLPAGYLNFYLTGDFVADMSDSAGTSWLDVEQRSWSEHLLKAGSMNKDMMPRLVEGTEVAGTLRTDIRKRWGLSREVLVCGGAGDNAAAACGVGALKEGEGFVSLGTSGVVLIARDSFRPAPETAVHTFCHAVPDKWYQMGVMLSASDSLNWLSRITNVEPSKMTNALGDVLCPPGDVLFLPYLSGERTPHNDSQVRGGFRGLSVSTDQNDLTRAVLEGVSFGLKDCLEALKSTGANVSSLTAIGGGSASPYWLTLLATVLGIPLKTPAGREFGAAIGAARLAAIAATGAKITDFIAAPDTEKVVMPVEGKIDAFNNEYDTFRRAYTDMTRVQ